MLANAAAAFVVGMLNGMLVATVAGSALTIAGGRGQVIQQSGVLPTFLDASAGYAVSEQMAALSITVPYGATLGTDQRAGKPTGSESASSIMADGGARCLQFAQLVGIVPWGRDLAGQRHRDHPRLGQPADLVHREHAGLEGVSRLGLCGVDAADDRDVGQGADEDSAVRAGSEAARDTVQEVTNDVLTSTFLQ
jgi:hypothetical protein